MRKVVLFVLLFSLICCKNNETSIFIIKQNNEYLFDNLDLTKHIYKVRSEENKYFTKEYPLEIEKTVQSIRYIKNYEGYEKCLIILNKFQTKYNLSVEHKSVKDCEVEFLKNDLLLFFIKLNKTKNLNGESIDSSHCLFGKPFSNYYIFEKDSIRIETISKHENNFELITDSIIELQSGKKILSFKSKRDKIINTISFPRENRNNKFIYYGKIFHYYAYENMEFTQRINDTIYYHK